MKSPTAEEKSVIAQLQIREGQQFADVLIALREYGDARAVEMRDRIAAEFDKNSEEVGNEIREMPLDCD